MLERMNKDTTGDNERLASMNEILQGENETMRVQLEEVRKQTKIQDAEKAKTDDRLSQLKAQVERDSETHKFAAKQAEKALELEQENARTIQQQMNEFNQ